MGDDVEQVGELLLAGSLTALAVLGVGFWSWRLAQRWQIALLPPAKVWRSIWNGRELLLIIAALYLILVVCHGAGMPPLEGPLCAFLIQLTVVVFLQRVGRGRRGHVESSGWRVYAARIALAAACWAIWTPLVYVVHVASEGVCRYYGGDTRPHPLTQIDRSNLYDVFLLIMQACVISPWFEEYLMRGLLLPWLIVTPLKELRKADSSFSLTSWVRRQWLVLSVSLLPALEGIDQGAVYFWVVLVIGFAVLQLLHVRHRRHWGAIYTAAALFALLHSEVWPSPIPLFVLGLGLGWLAVWTRGIAGPVMLHATFNLVATLHLVLFGTP